MGTTTNVQIQQDDDKYDGMPVSFVQRCSVLSGEPTVDLLDSLSKAVKSEAYSYSTK